MSQPLYKGSTLVGVISMDVLLSRLHQQLQALTPKLGGYLLINQYDQVLACSNSDPHPQQHLAPDDQYRWNQGGFQLTQALSDTPLRLVHRIPLFELLVALICQSAPTLLAIAFMLLAALSSLRSRRLNLQLNYLSCHDALTGAFNRHYLSQQEQSGQLAKQMPVGVILFDADHFKRVNDRFGHGVGDIVLIRLVQICQQQLSPSDCLIRWGGEEFLLLVARCDDARLAALAEQIRSAVEGYDWRAIVPELAVTISLGYHPHTDSIPLHEAIRRADVALYQAKGNGRNRSERWQGDEAQLTE